jgi:hypothetical protein
MGRDLLFCAKSAIGYISFCPQGLSALKEIIKQDRLLWGAFFDGWLMSEFLFASLPVINPAPALLTSARL